MKGLANRNSVLIKKSTEEQIFPTISGELIVYQQSDPATGRWVIYLLDLATGVFEKVAS